MAQIFVSIVKIRGIHYGYLTGRTTNHGVHKESTMFTKEYQSMSSS